MQNLPYPAVGKPETRRIHNINTNLLSDTGRGMECVLKRPVSDGNWALHAVTVISYPAATGPHKSVL